MSSGSTIEAGPGPLAAQAELDDLGETSRETPCSA